MSNNTDTELFELCKEVYERTKWRGEIAHDADGELTDLWFNSMAGWVVEKQAFANALEDEPGDWIPLYTSDYLMERLPKGTYIAKGKNYRVWVESNKHGDFPEGMDAYDGKTPLIALLKLVLALHKGGIL